MRLNPEVEPEAIERTLRGVSLIRPPRLVVNQFTVKEGNNTDRPDVMVFLKGLLVAVIELKNAARENATVWDSCQQPQTYKSELPPLFSNNIVKRVLRKHGYPPDKQEEATRIVLEQAELLSAGWAEAR